MHMTAHQHKVQDITARISADEHEALVKNTCKDVPCTLSMIPSHLLLHTVTLAELDTLHLKMVCIAQQLACLPYIAAHSRINGYATLLV